MTFKVYILATLMTASAAASFASQARYGGEERGSRLMPAQVNATWQQECGSCHIAYPPGLLPSASWKKVMSGLDKHFGTNASLSDPDHAAVTEFLVKNASNRWTFSAAPLRITEARWYQSRHSELSPAVFKRASIMSRSNCSACHKDAAKGVLNERGVKVPR